MKRERKREQGQGAVGGAFLYSCFFISEQKPTAADLAAGGRRQRLEPLARVLGDLETHFTKGAKLDDANEAYFYRMRAEDASADGWEKGARRMFWFVWGWPYRYGTSAAWAAGWLIGVVVVFALAYNKADLALRMGAHSGSVRLRLFETPTWATRPAPMGWRPDTISQRVWAALKLSTCLCCKVGSRDTQVGGTILGVNASVWVWIEWVLGFYLLGAALITASNTLPVVNKLMQSLKPLL